ncbi:hypothetical protein K402DRAFT_394342 [Aulographum hederae CBS 113979]|uniref:Uncharacterized protein n=1 Tax=Aulographum hederae CBS 113979 TaxID=1176131 RepID=A0A6G1GYC0_9PEZI|nr:hypothetical protein K402DRAFT_394342 [Aulographum hederae CBS 113979]
MENRFRFERMKSTRVPYWDITPKEVGFKDAHLMLKSAGPKNIQLLRDVMFVFDDAMMSNARNLSKEKRRFVQDDHLISCMRMLGMFGKLRKIELSFHGRRELYRSDVRFLEALYTMQADEIAIVPHPTWSKWQNAPPKVHTLLKEAIVNEMTRRKKIYQTNAK